VVVLLLSLRLGIAIASAEVPGFAEPSSRPEAEIELLANSGSRAAPPHQRRGSLHSASLTGDLLGLAGRESLKMASIGHRPLSRGALRRDAAASVPCRAKEHSSSDGSFAWKGQRVRAADGEQTLTTRSGRTAGSGVNHRAKLTRRPGVVDEPGDSSRLSIGLAPVVHHQYAELGS
jgi:hypothetical protein